MNTETKVAIAAGIVATGISTIIGACKVVKLKRELKTAKEQVKSFNEESEYLADMVSKYERRNDALKETLRDLFINDSKNSSKENQDILNRWNAKLKNSTGEELEELKKINDEVLNLFEIGLSYNAIVLMSKWLNKGE